MIQTAGPVGAEFRVKLAQSRRLPAYGMKPSLHSRLKGKDGEGVRGKRVSEAGKTSSGTPWLWCSFTKRRAAAFRYER